MIPLDKFVTKKLEEVHPSAPSKKMGTLEEWLENNFRVKSTKDNYRKALGLFVKAIYGETQHGNMHEASLGVDRYLKDQRNFLDDFKQMVRYMNSKSYASGYIHGVCSKVRKFFDRHGFEIAKRDWEDMKTSLLPVNVTATQDDILTKEQLRNVLNHMAIHGRALTLFLLSTGARIGETLQLKMTDLDLDADPPSVNIRPQYTKKGLGGRIIWMSYEARDALKEWLKVKESRRKRRTNEPFPRDMVFGFSAANFRVMWRASLDKVGLGQRDPSTKIKLYVYHVHTLRKFFRTQMGLAKVSDMVVHAWMGHKAYLNTYDKLGKEEMAKRYRDHMAAVSVYVSDEEANQSQVIITEDELNSYLATGWTFKATLPSGKIVVEGKPGLIKPALKEESKKEEKATINVEPKTEVIPQTIKTEARPPTKPLSKPLIVKEQPKEIEKPKAAGYSSFASLKEKPSDYITCTKTKQAHKLEDLPCMVNVSLICHNEMCKKQIMKLIKY